MNNYQKYEKEIIDFISENEDIGIDKDTNKPKACVTMMCNECKFSNRTKSCDSLLAEWLSAEYKEPIVLTEFEKEVLKRAKKAGYNYISRNSRNILYLHRNFSDYKLIDNYESFKEFLLFLDIANKDFQFIKWEDDEPYSIDELLKECEQ